MSRSQVRKRWTRIPRAATLFWSIFVGACCGPSVASAAAAETDPRALRRTAAVEVFQRCQAGVVYVTGPVVPAGPPTLEEFFNLPGKKLQNNVGSGFVVHESGYVLTNAHAAERIVAPEVALSDGTKHPAEVVASIRNEDVALLKIDAGHPLPALTLARSGDLMIGEEVIIIANPYELRFTCTTGIVSATGRRTNLLDVPGVTLREMIQTDAGINPGSSGGPWFNVVGEVIGMTASMKKDSQNIGFAVPAATLRRLMPAMLDVERRAGFVTGLAVPTDGPCRVSKVASDSPAARVGIQAGDLVVKLAGKPTPTALDFHLALVGRKADETLTLGLVRGGKPLEVSLTLARRPKPDAVALLREKLGLEAVALDEQKAKALSLRVPRGVVITGCDSKLFESLDQQPCAGDVLARINKIRPRDLDHLGLILDRVEPGQKVSMVLLRRRDKTLTRIDVGITLPK